MLTLEQCAPLVGTEFSVQTSVGTVALRLVRADELPRRNLPQQFRTPLSLILDAPDGVLLEGGAYQLSHPALGQLQLDITPVVSAIAGPFGPPQYQVLFA